MNFSDLKSDLLIAELCFLVLAVILILMQNRGAGLGTTFGGKDEIYLTRRGIEKTVVNLTTFSIAAFCIVRIVALYFS